MVAGAGAGAMVSELAGGVAAGGVVSVVSSEPEQADSAKTTPAKLASQSFFMRHLDQEPKPTAATHFGAAPLKYRTSTRGSPRQAMTNYCAVASNES